MVEINSAIKNKIRLFLKTLNENGINTEKVYIFGSYSKGTENSLSDIDIAVISSDLSDETERNYQTCEASH